MDDTLWDTYHDGEERLEELYTDYHFNRYYASFEAFFDTYMPHNLGLWTKYHSGEIDRRTLILNRLLCILHPLGIEDKKIVSSVNNDFLQRTTTKTRLAPGAIKLLEYLRPSYRLFILSSGFREVQFKKPSNAGLAPYFERMILSEDANIQKPHKGIFDFVLKNTNSCRSGGLTIGGSWEADIIGAYQSKIDQTWLNPEGLPADGFNPTHTVRSLEEIKPTLQTDLSYNAHYSMLTMGIISSLEWAS